MVRQKLRKSVEELYNTKFEASPHKSQVNHNASKSTRTDRNCADNFLTIPNTIPSNGFIGGVSSHNTLVAASLASSRGTTTTRTTTRRSVQRKTDTTSSKYYQKDEKIAKDDGQIGVGHHINAKSNKTRNESSKSFAAFNCDPKEVSQCMQQQQHKQQKHSHQNQMNHQSHHHDDEKDDDTDEFFELIRQTVENAIGKTIFELLNRNFREISSKLDRFASELKTTNAYLGKIQTEINNKVVHYGEENSRHFRYLCMKSEYDKMFYQHHAMLVSTNPQSTSIKMPSRSDNLTAKESKKNISKMKKSNNCNKAPNHCSSSRGGATNNKIHQPEHPKSSSEEHSVSQKSSELGMREVLEQLQRFCTQMQMNDIKKNKRVPNHTFRMDEPLKIDKRDFEDDDDEDFQLSSDGMTPRSEENSSPPTVVAHKHGGVAGSMTVRNHAISTVIHEPVLSGGGDCGGGDA